MNLTHILKNLVSNTLFIIREVNDQFIKNNRRLVIGLMSMVLVTTLAITGGKIVFAKESDLLKEEETEQEYTTKDILEEIDSTYTDEEVNEGWNFGRESESEETNKAEDSNKVEESKESNKVEDSKELGSEEVIYKTLANNHELEFVKTVLEDAKLVSQEYNIYTSIMVAQSILESNWGRSPLAVNAHNLFGVKGSYKGESVQQETKEDDGTGYQYTIIDTFAKYPSFKESMESNARLLRNGTSYDAEFYKGTWKENASDYKQATQSLTGTYATDTSYQHKLNTIIERHHLHLLD